MVDRAPARFGIQKLARFTKDRIGFAAQDTFFTVQLREPLAGNFNGHAEMCGQPLHVPLSHLHALINRATVPRAFRTVIITARLVVSRCGYHDRSECVLISMFCFRVSSSRSRGYRGFQLNWKTSPPLRFLILRK